MKVDSRNENTPLRLEAGEAKATPVTNVCDRRQGKYFHCLLSLSQNGVI